MEITRIVKDKDGNVEATMQLKPEQAAYLINVGLLTLVQTGSLMFTDVDEQGQPTTLAQQAEVGSVGEVNIQES